MDELNTTAIDISLAITMLDAMVQATDVEGEKLPSDALLYFKRKLAETKASMVNDLVEAVTANVSVFDDVLNWPKEDEQ